MNRKGPWEGYRRPLSPSRLPLRAHFHQKRDVWVRGRTNQTFKLKFIFQIKVKHLSQIIKTRGNEKEIA